jgi:hypothetical protein
MERRRELSRPQVPLAAGLTSTLAHMRLLLGQEPSVDYVLPVMRGLANPRDRGSSAMRGPAHLGRAHCGLIDALCRRERRRHPGEQPCVRFPTATSHAVRELNQTRDCFAGNQSTLTAEPGACRLATFHGSKPSRMKAPRTLTKSTFCGSAQEAC